MQKIRTRPRKREKFSEAEIKALNGFIDAQETKYDAAIALELSRVTLDNLIKNKYGAPTSVLKVRAAISPFLQKAVAIWKLFN